MAEASPAELGVKPVRSSKTAGGSALDADTDCPPCQALANVTYRPRVGNFGHPSGARLCGRGHHDVRPRASKLGGLGDIGRCRLRLRGTSGLRRAAVPYPRAAPGCGTVRGCTCGTSGQERCAGTRTRAGSRSGGRSGCGFVRQGSCRDFTPRAVRLLLGARSLAGRRPAPLLR